MNMHVPQCIQTMIELKYITDVKRQIMNPGPSKPTMGLIHDGVIGGNLFTRDNIKIDAQDAMNLLLYTSVKHKKLIELEKNKLYSGREIYSMILPPNINAHYKKDGKTTFRIINSKLTDDGAMTKEQLGASKNGLVHHIWNQYRHVYTKNFLDDSRRLITQWLKINGFSVGMKDMIISKKLRKQFEAMISIKKMETNQMITEMENNNILRDFDLFEYQIQSELGVLRDNIAKIIMNNLTAENSFNVMISSGARGTIMNMGQMTGCLGQQNIEAKRVQKKLNNRTLPCYFQNEDGLDARGFIANCFLNGLNPQEFFFHAMSGREGLIDTAIKSVTVDTRIVIIEDGISKYVCIGPWINNKLKHNLNNIEISKKSNQELLELKNDVFIPTTDSEGNVTWGEVTAVTRHDPPGNKLYEIKTHGGRTVTVVESKSLLIWNKKIKEFEHTFTPDVKVGDYMPVTMNLPKPPNIIKTLNIEKYLPKDEYIHGTDFNMAKTMINKAMKGKQKIISGWWKKNNKIKFVLPYTKKASVTRALKRSDTKNIKSGYVYPYAGKRKATLIPEEFELNEENGIFIGLYLAEGDSNVKDGHVRISNNDKRVKTFVKKWFEKHSMIYEESTKINHIGGTSSAVRGYSTILADFLIKFVGCGARNKYVPRESYTAPISFIKGLLNGYISGDGHISKNSIIVGSASSKLIDGISMLCNRLGIFGKVTKTIITENNLGTENIAPRYALSIRCQWAKLFSEKIELIEPNKQIVLNKIKTKDCHINFEEQNDVVLDKIIEINEIDIEENCKVYDLTIPSTLNFGLANGLHVADTAESGYIQRKLVKALEDFMVKYDGTVRNARDILTQCIYGESGLDMRYQVEQKIHFIAKNNKDIENEYIFKTDQLKKYGMNEQINNDIYKRIIQIRDKLRITQEKSIQNYSLVKDVYMYAVNVNTLIENYRSSDQYKESKTKLDATYVANTLVTLLNNKYTPIMKMNDKQANDPTSYKYRDEQLAKIVVEAGLYEYLCPKKCCIDYEFSKEQFDDLIKEFIEKFKRAVVQPGEMVGTLAAQSIGAPATQLCAEAGTRIIVQKAGKMYNTTIGEFIDEEMNLQEKYVQSYKGSDILPVNEKHDDIQILSVGKKEKVKWCNVTELSRHPAHGSMIRIKTSTGREVETTLSHSFLKRTKHGIEPVKGSDLKIGDRVPVAKNTPFLNNVNDTLYIHVGDEKYELDEDLCQFIGFFVAEGSTCKNNDEVAISTIQKSYQKLTHTIFKRFTNNEIKTYEKEQSIMGSTKKYKGCDTKVVCSELSEWLRSNCGTYCDNKHLPAFAFKLNKAQLGALLKGLFDGDGNVAGNRKSVKYHSISKKLIEQLSLLLTYFGITCSYSIERKTQITKNGSELQDLWVLLIFGGEQGKIFYENIGTDLDYKNKEFKKFINKTEKGQYNDQIPAVACYLDTIAKGLPGKAKKYSRWLRKEKEGCAVGRKTLESYIDELELKDTHNEYVNEINKLKQAVNSDVFWDKIVDIEIKETDELVYDFSVADNETFVILNGLYVHNTLNTFHQAGTGSKTTATLGVPRLRELMSLSRNPKTPQMIIPLAEEYKDNKIMAYKIASNLKYTVINDLAETVQIVYDPEPFKENSIMEQDEVDNVYMTLSTNKASCQTDINGLPWLIRIVINRDAMLEKEVTLLDIQNKFCEFWATRYNDTKGMKKEDKLIIERIAKCSILANYDNAEQPIIHIRLEMSFIEKNTALSLKDTLIAFKDTVLHKLRLKGIAGITEIDNIVYAPYVTYNKDGSIGKENRYVIHVNGINLGEIRYVKGIDHNKVLTNHITEIYNWYGIEAARRSLIKEFKNVLEANGSGTNYQHWTILVDAMTQWSIMISIDRNGMVKLDSDPLPKATFEKTVEQLVIASIFREVDSMQSVSARIMTGQMINGGTGLCRLVLNNKLLESTDLPDTSNDWKKGAGFKKVTKDTIVEDLLNKEEDENDFIPD
jgi:DNA-directed RNA polymerase beta' subunit